MTPEQIRKYFEDRGFVSVSVYRMADKDYPLWPLKFDEPVPNVFEIVSRMIQEKLT